MTTISLDVQVVSAWPHPSLVILNTTAEMVQMKNQICVVSAHSRVVAVEISKSNFNLK